MSNPLGEKLSGNDEGETDQATRLNRGRMKQKIDYSKNGLQQFIKLFKKKYIHYEKLVIYNDESGAILSSDAREIHDYSETLFTFDSIEELLKHLEKK